MQLDFKNPIVDSGFTLELFHIVLRKIAGNVWRRDERSGFRIEGKTAGPIRRSHSEIFSRGIDRKHGLAIQSLAFGLVHHDSEVVVVDDLGLGISRLRLPHRAREISKRRRFGTVLGAA